MKVICIDASNGCWGVASSLLREGDIYTVIGNPVINPDGCLLAEAKHPDHPLYGFRKERFAPLSTIDETTFERNYNKHPV